MTTHPNTEQPTVTGANAARYYKKDCWKVENRIYLKPHYRLRKRPGLRTRLLAPGAATY